MISIFRVHARSYATRSLRKERACEKTVPMNEIVRRHPPLAPGKFSDPDLAEDGETRAAVAFRGLETLWLNTGTLCNIACANCYIDSSPTDDRLAYLTPADVTRYLDEIAAEDMPAREIGVTGGEPFMNPDILPILELCLARGFRVLVLTNAMRPLVRHREAVHDLSKRFGDALMLRVSIDHYTEAVHDAERGAGSWQKMLPGLRFLIQHAIPFHVAGRARIAESDSDMRAGFARLFADENIPLDAENAGDLVLFPEMDAAADVPEITDACWSILNIDPGAMMCASARMVVRRRDSDRTRVVACTLLPDSPEFDLGDHLADAIAPVKLNHPHCARFCVLGGASCG